MVRLCVLRVVDTDVAWRDWFDCEARRFLGYQLNLSTGSQEESRQQQGESFELQKKKQTTCFGIEDLEGKTIGWINLTTGFLEPGIFSLGIRLHQERQWQQYFGDAIQLVLRFSFYELGQNKGFSECLDMNLDLISLYEHLGFQEESRRRKVIYMNGGYHDIILYGLLKEKFEKIDERTINL